MTLNIHVDRVNKYCMEHISGEIVSLYSTDKVVNSDEQVRGLYTVDYINSLEPFTTPEEGMYSDVLDEWRP
jgi:hypothetical protein